MCIVFLFFSSFLFFFFQAEDGIRDFCLSRGLGDVYKRQMLGYYDQAHFIHEFKNYTSLTPNSFQSQLHAPNRTVIV